MSKSILDPTFRYRSSHNTDVRKTFERVRKELTRATQRAALPVNVSRIPRKEKP